MNALDLKKLFVDFFVSKDHAEIPSASLIPENDPSTLFISAGIQPLVPYFLGTPHPYGKRLVNVQKCIRTGDIDEVGDCVHHTFFEMLGNWSLGDYFKTEMIPLSFEFLTQKLNIPISKLAVSCFEGDADASKDQETADIWQKLGISPQRIAFLPKKNNWWGPPGVTGPCGPDTEMFYWAAPSSVPQIFDPNNSNWVEIWNDVLIQYFKSSQGIYEKLVQNNIDTGMGVERTLAVLSGFSDNYLTDIWQPIIRKIENISGQKYGNNQNSMRIIADHLRATVFIIADGVEPGNKEAGYVLRRLIRRSIRHGKILGIEQNFCQDIAQTVLDNQENLAGFYPELNQNKNRILEIIGIEETKFRKTLNRGLIEINKLIIHKKNLSGKEAFNLYQSYGFPSELIEEELKKNGLSLDIVEFNQSKEEHTKQSQTLSAGKFKSGLASERLRFDFSHTEKLNPDQLEKITNLINQQIENKLTVTKEEKHFIDAQKEGALAFFGTKYPKIVTVYKMGDFSQEVCTGPHATNTGTLGTFKIIKEESAGSGKRRIYAILK
ncbi:MAG: Alanine-tRNA ligase [Microgenomates group bacterium GW2011_GWA2_40_6]|nr:MAG: Alanine-tRNA ligase [Microgenomates group bacterium GW2011_GWA2_40_6]